MASNVNATTILMAGEHAATRVSFSRPWGTIASLITSDVLAVLASMALASVLRDYLLASASVPSWEPFPPRWRWCSAVF